jgi:hypothetical protein
MLAAKWAAARLLFRLHIPGSVLLGLSPLLYLPMTAFVLFATANLSYRFSPIFYRDSGDGRELLGLNVVFVAAFLVALAAMSLIDWVVVRGSLLRLFEGGSSAARRFMTAGWLLSGLANLAVWFFWIAVYLAIQVPHDVD